MIVEPACRHRQPLRIESDMVLAAEMLLAAAGPLTPKNQFTLVSLATLSLPMFSSAAICRRLSPFERKSAILRLSTILCGLPNRFPCRRALSNPIMTRSRINERSNSATAAITVNTMRPIGVAFTNVATDSSTPVSSGATAFVVLQGLIDGTSYPWQYRASDQTGRVSAWTSFGKILPGLTQSRSAPWSKAWSTKCCHSKAWS